MSQYLSNHTGSEVDVAVAAALALTDVQSPTPATTVTITTSTVARLVYASWTASQDVTVNKGSGTPPVPQELVISITASGADRQVTLGTGFSHPSGAKGLIFKIKSGKTVTLRFASNGSSYIEVDGRLPRGFVMIWSGVIADIADDWVLCDGNNGAPDLRDKFVVGARQDDAGVAKTNITGSLTQSGGATTHTHSYTGTIDGYSGTPTFVTEGGPTSLDPYGYENTYVGVTDASSSLGPYYAVAFIMKM